MWNDILKFLESTGIYKLFFAENATTPWWQYLIMYVIIGALFYLAIVKKFEPLLLMPIAFGMLLANLPGADLIHLDFFFDDYYIYLEGVKEVNGVMTPQFSGIFANEFTKFIEEIRLVHS